MTALNRMLIRDLLHMRSQAIVLALVVACGVASYVSMRSMYGSLLVARSDYYAAYRFADVFAQLKRAPEALETRIRDIPGVVGVNTRIVMDVTVDVPGLPEPATARLVSVPERQTPILNDLCLRQGRYIQPERSDEVLASEAFAGANGLRVGDSLGAVINGRWKALRIVGIALSPEYIYEVRGGGSFLPDNKRFGVLWMGRASMEPAFDMTGAFNDVALSLARDASEAGAIERLDRLLAPYGGLGAYGRPEQYSHRFISDEINQNRVSANIVPAIFLGVAAFLLHIVLSRLLSIERMQIALLKAFGYSNLTVGLHYMKLALAIVAGGVLLGSAVGLYFGSWITEVYREFYRFPLLRYEAGAGLMTVAALISFGAAGIGALGAVRRAVALPPAEAMRAPAPGAFRHGFLERAGLGRFFSFSARMIIRNLGRSRGKAILSVLGISFAAAILVVGWYFYDAFDYMMRLQFQTIQREDVAVYFNNPRSAQARFDVAHLPGVLYSETFREVPVRLRFGHHSKRVGILGVEPGARLRRLVDPQMRPVALPPGGLVLTNKLAQILGAGPGDRVTVEVLEGTRPVRQVAVSGVVDEVIGLSAYMDLRALNRMMREEGSISGAHMAVDRLDLPRLYSLLKRTPAVSAVAIREAVLQSFQEIIARSMTITTDVLIVFACIIAVGMVYNGARIALSERAGELAALRVLGFTNGEIAGILLGEQALLTMAAIPIGCLLGYGVCALLTERMATELYRIPLVVSGTTYLSAAAVVAAAAVLSGLLVAGRLKRLDLLAVLKARE